jgi:hypothetical protein
VSINDPIHKEGTTYNNNNTSHTAIIWTLLHLNHLKPCSFSSNNHIITVYSSDPVILFNTQHHLFKVSSEATRQLRKEKKEYLRAKTEELETHSEIKNIRDAYRTSMILRRVTSLELMQ